MPATLPDAAGPTPCSRRPDATAGWALLGWGLLQAHTSGLANLATLYIRQGTPDYKAHFWVQGKILVKRVHLIVMKLLYFAIMFFLSFVKKVSF